MPFFIVTIKIPPDLEHDPDNKKTGACPVGMGGFCTDITGGDHSLLVNATDINQARTTVTDATGYKRITRIEEI